MACELGLQLATEKTQGPSTSITFLGIELDPIKQSSRLPEDKLEVLKDHIGRLIESRKVSLKELQEMVGHLNFACKVVAPGRAFLCRLCDAMKGLHCPFHRMQMTSDMRQDFQVWSQFLADQHSKGADLCLAMCSMEELCPVKAMHAYLDLRGQE